MPVRWQASLYHGFNSMLALEHPSFKNNEFGIRFIDEQLSNYMNQKSNPKELSKELISSILTSAIIFQTKRNEKVHLNSVSQNNNWMEDDE